MSSSSLSVAICPIRTVAKTTRRPTLDDDLLVRSLLLWLPLVRCSSKPALFSFPAIPSSLLTLPLDHRSVWSGIARTRTL